MLFSDKIPEKILEHPTTASFINVLDELQNFKDELIGKSLRVNNVAVLNDRKWLHKKITDLGLENFPQSFPIPIMQQIVLNADVIFRTRGSKKGLYLFCSVLTLGSVRIDDRNMFNEPMFLMPDSLVQGFLTSEDSAFLYLIDNEEQLNPGINVSISISSVYFKSDVPQNIQDTITNYLESVIKNQLGFYNVGVTFSFSSRNDYVYHELLNSYFI